MQNNNFENIPDDINAFDHLQQFFEAFKGELNIIDEAIDVELQMDYFKASRQLAKTIAKEEILEKATTLYLPETPADDKKQILIHLASIDDVKAYRTIEAYINEQTELKHWAMLALQESKMLLQSKLLEQNQVFISTGLGGKGTKLRYFIVLLPETDNVFSEFQQKIIHDEFIYIFNKHDAEIEEIQFINNYATIIALVPMQVALTDLFSKTVKECNQFGNFIKNNCIITNVKKLNEQEISDFFNENNFSENDIDIKENDELSN
jgi:hypothetical protein